MQRPVCPSGTSQQPHARALRAAPPAAPPAAAPCSCRSGRGARHAPAAPAAANELAALAGSVDPALMQDLLVGGAITAAVGVALYTGLKKDPVPCDLCMGTGGIRCFACEGAGTVEKSRDSMDSMDGGSPTPRRRDPVGRSGGNPRACRVCGGTGLVLCSKCRGSGYVN